MRQELDNNTLVDEGGIYPADRTEYSQYVKDYPSGASHPQSPLEHGYRRVIKLLNLLVKVNKGNRIPNDRLIVESQISAICEALRILKQELQIEGGEDPNVIREREQNRRTDKRKSPWSK